MTWCWTEARSQATSVVCSKQRSTRGGAIADLRQCVTTHETSTKQSNTRPLFRITCLLFLLGLPNGVFVDDLKVCCHNNDPTELESSYDSIYLLHLVLCFWHAFLSDNRLTVIIGATNQCSRSHQAREAFQKSMLMVCLLRKIQSRRSGVVIRDPILEQSTLQHGESFLAPQILKRCKPMPVKKVSS